VGEEYDDDLAISHRVSLQLAPMLGLIRAGSLSVERSQVARRSSCNDIGAVPVRHERVWRGVLYFSPQNLEFFAELLLEWASQRTAGGRWGAAVRHASAGSHPASWHSGLPVHWRPGGSSPLLGRRCLA